MQRHEGGERCRGTAAPAEDAGASERGGRHPPPAWSHRVVGLRGPRDQTQLARHVFMFSRVEFWVTIGPILGPFWHFLDPLDPVYCI